MLRLEHVNLVVNDIGSTLEFLQTAIPVWKVRGVGENEWYGKKRQWLHIGTDDYYITLNEGDGGSNRDLQGHSSGLAHIGISVDDVEQLAIRMQSKGYEITTKSADHPYRKSIYFLDPAGFEFEFIQYFSSVAAEKNMYGGETSEMK